jgi:hypothetical protein
VVHAPLMHSDVSVCLLLMDWASNFWSRTGTANPRTATVDTIISIAIKLPENLSIGYTLKEHEANNVIKFLNVVFCNIYLKSRG